MTATSARAWRVVLNKIEGDLLSGALQPGDRLPSERDLAATLGVGRSSVREALRVLEVMGLIRTATGSGPNAGAIIIGTPNGGMSALLRLQTAAQTFAIDDIVRTRVALESNIVRVLAEADTPDTEEIERLLDAMDEPQLAPREFVALDAQLHLAMAEAAGNGVMTAMMAGLRDAIEGYVIREAESRPNWPGTSVHLRQEHRRILELIVAGDADAAQQQIAAHIHGYYVGVTPSAGAR